MSNKLLLMGRRPLISVS